MAKDNNDVRELPKNIEAEQVVLGAAMLEPEAAMPLLAGILIPDDFYDRKHRIIYRCMIELFAISEPCDIVVLANRLEERGDMERAGGRLYLSELLDRTTTIASVEYYRDIVKKKATLRKLIEVGGRIAEVGYDEKSEVSEVLDKAESLMFDVSSSEQKDGSSVMLSEYIRTRVMELSEIHSRADRHATTGLETGIIELDEITSGLQPSDLIVVAGRPSMGKSSLATTIAAHASVHGGKKIALFSLEMSKAQVTDRIISTVGLINLYNMRSGKLDAAAFRSVTLAASKLVNTTVIIDDSPGISVMEIRSRSRLHAIEHNGLDLIIVDYIQLVDAGIKMDKREQEVAFISRSLKKLAREMNTAVIAVSQLNRSGEMRKDKRPILSDLRESGSIEQDADVVIFVYRPGYHDDNADKERNIMISPSQLIVAKQRNGPQGIINVAFYKAYSAFVNHTYSPNEKKSWNT